MPRTRHITRPAVPTRWSGRWRNPARPPAGSTYPGSEPPRHPGVGRPLGRIPAQLGFTRVSTRAMIARSNGDDVRRPSLRGSWRLAGCQRLESGMELGIDQARHIEQDETRADAPVRETVEEPGLRVRLLACPSPVLPVGYPHKRVAAPWWITEVTVPGTTTSLNRTSTSIISTWRWRTRHAPSPIRCTRSPGSRSATWTAYLCSRTPGARGGTAASHRIPGGRRRRGRCAAAAVDTRSRARLTRASPALVNMRDGQQLLHHGRLGRDRPG